MKLSKQAANISYVLATLSNLSKPANRPLLISFYEGFLGNLKGSGTSLKKIIKNYVNPLLPRALFLYIRNIKHQNTIRFLSFFMVEKYNAEK